MLKAFRIVSRKWVQNCFNGEGARLHGGRWNSPGVAVVYLASSRSLAALEMLVHFSSAMLKMKYVIIDVSFDMSLVETIDLNGMPKNWNCHPASEATIEIGNEWVAQNRSPLLSVPSAIVPEENNYLLNPFHPDFRQIKISEPKDFCFDARLV